MHFANGDLGCTWAESTVIAAVTRLRACTCEPQSQPCALHAHILSGIVSKCERELPRIDPYLTWPPRTCFYFDHRQELGSNGRVNKFFRSAAAAEHLWAAQCQRLWRNKYVPRHIRAQPARTALPASLEVSAYHKKD